MSITRGCNRLFYWTTLGALTLSLSACNDCAPPGDPSAPVYRFLCKDWLGEVPSPWSTAECGKNKVQKGGMQVLDIGSENPNGRLS